ncbi:hypothetical protein [Chitinophaga pinensis]|uniref:Sigma-70 family RNA polymerase sigma factor n=1 Tax=Chitinophaga pinensis TaxID=79329 RepID=A0A5C6LK49_9BACT|nr:hypothetical protein [Chitinophaga pinensis]TWV92209.1 hypothetical protein FEF09_28355 [Chitinophaga pinensis]
MHSYQLYTDPDVLARAAAGDGYAYSIITREHIRPLCYFIYKKYGWRDSWRQDAAECAAIVFSSLKDNKVHFSDIGGLKSFLYTSMAVAAEELTMYDIVFSEPADVLTEMVLYTMFPEMPVCYRQNY